MILEGNDTEEPGGDQGKKRAKEDTEGDDPQMARRMRGALQFFVAS
jgi:hypothetical protein